MCYVVPFTLPCCRRTYVSVTKMKDCPADWPTTKCPKELCFQIGLQPDDRDEGTCWRCKAAEAGVPPEERERLRPGIDSADVERFIVPPEERRSQMEEDGFCWFCGHKSGCESCEPVKINGLEERLLGKNRVVDVVEETKPVNKRLKIEHSKARSKANASVSKLKPKARPQNKVVSKFGLRSSSFLQSTPSRQLQQQREFSLSKDRPQVLDHKSQEKSLKPELEYAGYGDQSHIFDPTRSGMYRPFSSKPGGNYSGYGDQSQVLDPRLFTSEIEAAPSGPEQNNQSYEQPHSLDPALAIANDIACSKPGQSYNQNHQQTTNHPYFQTPHQQRSGQFNQAFDPDKVINHMGYSDMLGDYYTKNHDLTENDKQNYEYPDPSTLS